MLLFSKGQEKYFDPYLLTSLVNQKYTEVIHILQSYCRNENSSVLSQLKDSLQATLLHYAAEFGNAVIVQHLLDAKCEIDAQDNLGKSPLMLAVTRENEANLEVLLKANANIHLIDFQGKTALQMAIDLGSSRFMMLNKFFEHVAWHKIIEGITPGELAKKVGKVIGDTPIIAVLLKSAQLVKVLLDHEILAVDVCNLFGDTLLHEAIRMGNIEIAKVLIECGADVDALDRHKATPLYYLYCEHPRYSNAEALEVLKVSMTRATVLTASTTHGSMQVSNALWYGNDDAIETILQSSVDLNATDESGNTALHYLARNRGADLMKLMRGRIFDVNARNDNGMTPLHVAAKMNSCNAIKCFLKNGADVNAVSNSGRTPLYSGFDYFRALSKPSIEILLNYGADPQTHNHNGKTIFDLIMQYSSSFQPDARSLEVLARAEPLLARLAIVQGLGVKITDLMHSKIKLQSSWAEYFDNCQKQVERMKKTTVYSYVTLFQFLTESEKKLIACVRNEELVSELDRAIEEFEVESSYPELLRSRLARAIKLIELKNKAMTVICQLINLKNDVHYFPAEYVVHYLSKEDMKNLHLAWNEGE